MATSAPLTLALVGDCELIAQGLAKLLEPFRDRVRLVDLDEAKSAGVRVEVALYDIPAADRAFGPDVQADHVVLYTLKCGANFVAAAQANGAAGVLSKSMEPPDLVEALQRIHADEVLVVQDYGPDGVPPAGGWPKRPLGISDREAAIVALITQGLNNEEIAHRLCVSQNTVKSYIRSAYRKMDVSARSCAVLWGVDHGFARPHEVERPFAGR